MGANSRVGGGGGLIRGLGLNRGFTIFTFPIPLIYLIISRSIFTIINCKFYSASYLNEPVLTKYVKLQVSSSFGSEDNQWFMNDADCPSLHPLSP